MIDPRVTRSAMLMMVGKNYGGMFSQLDAKYGKKSAPKKQHYTNVIRSWENSWLTPSQRGVYSNKMQATLDKQKPKKTVQPLSKAKRKATYTPTSSKGASLLKRPKASRSNRAAALLKTKNAPKKEDKLG